MSQTKVFFGHQSVGMNVMNGVVGLYKAHGMTAPAIEQGGARPDRDGGFIDHAFIGENGQPCSRSRISTRRCARALAGRWTWR